MALGWWRCGVILINHWSFCCWTPEEPQLWGGELPERSVELWWLEKLPLGSQIMKKPSHRTPGNALPVPANPQSNAITQWTWDGAHYRTDVVWGTFHSQPYVCEALLTWLSLIFNLGPFDWGKKGGREGEYWTFRQQVWSRPALVKTGHTANHGKAQEQNYFMGQLGDPQWTWYSVTHVGGQSAPPPLPHTSVHTWEAHRKGF